MMGGVRRDGAMEVFQSRGFKGQVNLSSKFSCGGVKETA